MIEATVRAWLIASPQVCAGRVYVDFVDEETVAKPYTVIYSIGGAPILAQDAEPVLREMRLQISVFGASGTEVRTESEKIRDKLHYQRWSDANHRVQSCLAQEEIAVQRETEAELYQLIQDYRIRYV